MSSTIKNRTFLLCDLQCHDIVSIYDVIVPSQGIAQGSSNTRHLCTVHSESCAPPPTYVEEEGEEEAEELQCHSPVRVHTRTLGYALLYI